MVKHRMTAMKMLTISKSLIAGNAYSYGKVSPRRKALRNGECKISGLSMRRDAFSARKGRSTFGIWLLTIKQLELLEKSPRTSRSFLFDNVSTSNKLYSSSTI